MTQKMSVTCGTLRSNAPELRAGAQHEDQRLASRPVDRVSQMLPWFLSWSLETVTGIGG